LLEVIIGLVLTAFLVTYMLSFWVESVRVETKLETVRRETLQKAQTQTRLQTLFTALVPSSALFYTKHFPKEPDLSLSLLFDHGIDPDPSFSGPVHARLYIDPEKNLTLAIWPQEELSNPLLRKEILLKNVAKLDWEFLGSKQGTAAPDKKARSINASLQWRSSWPPGGLEEIPAIVRLTATTAEGPVRFAFRLPAGSVIPLYLDGVKA
jgi:hypothetical protein